MGETILALEANLMGLYGSAHRNVLMQILFVLKQYFVVELSKIFFC